MSQGHEGTAPRTPLGPKAREVLVMEHLLLAKWVAARFVGKGLDREDLDQAATLGLMRAAELFDPHRGTKFTTYATWWCRQFVRRAIDRESRTIRLPTHVVESLGRKARAHAYGDGRDELTECESAALKALHLSSPDDDDEVTFDPAHEAAGPLEVSQRAENAAVIRDAIAQLPGRLRTVIERRFGIDCEPETLWQIGARLGVSRERARQLELDAIRALAQSEGLAGFGRE